ncbi:MAG: HD domain-containing protein [candidate division KSB1 bacterium]|nr:HD domain-containing protein [candidate division KSB1 bacterium]MDZ7304643.1 HD domain-containing protein [candidate division KSB1 bacterium]MDZ7313775.1 HD domain-containing protein [candidate division KSB1 bacterium]
MKQIADLILGEKFTAFFVVRRKDIKKKKSGEPYLILNLVDASGHMDGIWWDFTPNLFGSDETENVEVGDIVKVAGSVEEYQGVKQIRVEKIRRAKPEDGVDLSRLVPTTETDRQLLWQNFRKLIDSVTNPYLLSLLRRIFDDEAFAKRFMDSPGGKQWHHNYLGGLMEHTLNTATICDRLAKIYPAVDRDLLVAAALVHDIGKVESYTHGPLFEYTDAGRLLGHVVIGSQMVAEKINEFPEFPKELTIKLQHLILSHQGKLEQASPVEPMTREGFILYYADEIDSKLNAFDRISKEERPSSVKWSKFVNLLGRYLYLGEASK